MLKSRDCAPVDELEPVPYADRAIPEAARLAQRGLAEKRASESVEGNESTSHILMGEAAKDLITALAADPYNVRATYGLAGLYARVGAKQCALGLLTRLVRIRTMRSQTAEVDTHLDRLLGRTTALDPDFHELRADAGFGPIVAAVTNNTPLAAVPAATPGTITVVLPYVGALPRIPDIDDAP
ncbi:MAG: hypothetical protein H0V17_23580 [Deltaproteobacteria bacterium]|nr:hypothetical protein [Deltaproteobacteria bacterium]